jgi:hypothetical protein
MTKTEITESMLESIVWIAIMQKGRGEKSEDVVKFINEIVFKKS